MRAVHWFRNDLRLRDNRALREAATRADEVLPVFVLDPRILESPRTGASRVHFMLDCLRRLARDLERRGAPLRLLRGDPREVLPRFVAQQRADALFFNRDTSPYASTRDRAVCERVEALGIRAHSCKDRVVFEAGEVRTGAGRPFSVYSPFRRAWWQRLSDEPAPPQAAPRLPRRRDAGAGDPVPEAAELGFDASARDLPTGGEAAARRRLALFLDETVEHYAERRDRPDLDGTSRLSPYLRFGALSVRDCIESAVRAASEDARRESGVRKWLDELVWREFYAAILESHPRVLHGAYREVYDRVRWNRDERGFRAWCEGRTGFPIVDAGMRQLARTGWVHNRVRMLVASFLVKDLLIDWRRGEAFFFQQLVDGDPASNNGGWQWSASTGTDAAPYFRIFNPTTQARRFDPEGDYVRRHVPELRALSGASAHEPWRMPALAPDYPAPIIDHAERRREALARFRAVAPPGPA